MSKDSRALPECEVILPITPPSWCAALGIVEPDLVGLQGKALTRHVTRKLQFVVHAADWLHCMVLHGRTENDLRSARAVRRRRTSYSQLVHVCSWSYLWLVGSGQGWRWMVSMRDKARISLSHVE